MSDTFNKEEKLNSIKAILDETVKPVLANDGGGLTVVGLNDDNTLQIHYEGACGGCPSATLGTLRFIQETLRQKLDPELKVEAV
jgi:Fe-S cluster biogenesis protein NfuA